MRARETETNVKGLFACRILGETLSPLPRRRQSLNVLPLELSPSNEDIDVSHLAIAVFNKCNPAPLLDLVDIPEKENRVHISPIDDSSGRGARPIIGLSTSPALPAEHRYRDLRA
jgi:hypothetical protein